MGIGSNLSYPGSAGGIGSGGDVNGAGGSSGPVYGNSSVSFCISTAGGSSIYGGGAVGTAANGGGGNYGNNGYGYGGGGSGSVASPSSSGLTGGSGTPGIVIITEYIA